MQVSINLYIEPFMLTTSIMYEHASSHAELLYKRISAICLHVRQAIILFREDDANGYFHLISMAWNSTTVCMLRQYNDSTIT